MGTGAVIGNGAKAQASRLKGATAAAGCHIEDDGRGCRVANQEVRVVFEGPVAGKGNVGPTALGFDGVHLTSSGDHLGVVPMLVMNWLRPASMGSKDAATAARDAIRSRRARQT